MKWKTSVRGSSRAKALHWAACRRTSLRYFDQVDFDGQVVDSRAHARG